MDYQLIQDKGLHLHRCYIFLVSKYPIDYKKTAVTMRFDLKAKKNSLIQPKREQVMYLSIFQKK